MGRRAQFTDTEVFDWLGRHLAEAPSVTVQQVSKGTGVSVGSIYHRYGSMDGLLATAWLAAARSYRGGLGRPLSRGGEGPMRRIALHAGRWAEARPALARLLFCVPERVLVRGDAGESLEAMIAQENAEFAGRVAGFVERNGLNPVRAELGLFVLPQRIVAGYVGEPQIFRQVKPLILNTLFAMLPASNSSSPDAEDDSDDDLENVSDKA
jgi:AcrR family transcriptional regulator